MIAPKVSNAKLRAGVQREDVIEAMIAIYERLQVHIERAAATPAMRLLDDALHIMTSDVGDNEDVRFTYAVAALERAFGGGGLPPGANVLEIAREIGETGETSAEKDVVEGVPRAAFIAEVGMLLNGADEKALELHAALDLKKVRGRDV